jgi:hypothetical protein
MSEEDKAAARTIALAVIADYRDRGCAEPEPVGPELLKEMMQGLVCEPVPWCSNVSSISSRDHRSANELMTAAPS